LLSDNGVTIVTAQKHRRRQHLILDRSAEQALAHVRPAEVDSQRHHSRHEQRAKHAGEHKLSQLGTRVKCLVRNGTSKECKNAGKDSQQADCPGGAAEGRPLVEHALTDLLELVDGSLESRDSNLKALIIDDRVWLVSFRLVADRLPSKPRAGAACRAVCANELLWMGELCAGRCFSAQTTTKE
jgi:hypothetical protein